MYMWIFLLVLAILIMSYIGIALGLYFKSLLLNFPSKYKFDGAMRAPIFYFLILCMSLKTKDVKQNEISRFMVKNPYITLMVIAVRLSRMYSETELNQTKHRPIKSDANEIGFDIKKIMTEYSAA